MVSAIQKKALHYTVPQLSASRSTAAGSGGASSAAENCARGVSSAIARAWAPRWDVEYELGLDVEALLALQQVLRVRVEIMRWQKCRVLGKSQSVLMMINPIIFTRTRTLCAWASARCDDL